MTTMTVKSKKDLPVKDRILILVDEILDLQDLIDRRTFWLNKPESKRKGTYNAVAEDTRQMEAKLDEMKTELEDLKKKIA